MRRSSSKQCLTKSNATIKCYEFDFARELQDNGFNVVFGKRGSGKTSLTRCLTQHVPNAFAVQWIFFIGTEEVKKLYRSISHPYYVRDPTKEAFDELLMLQKWKVQVCEQFNIPFPVEWELHIVCDDCGAFAWFLRSKAVQEIASNGRNAHITFYAIIQKYEQLEPVSRECTSTFIGLRTQKEAVITNINKDYSSTFDKTKFQELYMTVTAGRRALCISCVEGEADDHNLAFTHCSLLHPDGFEAAANQQEIDMFNAKRAKQGRPPRVYQPQNMLKRLGHQLHYDIAVENYRETSLAHLVASNMLMKYAFANSPGMPVFPKKPAAPRRKKSICSYEEHLDALTQKAMVNEYKTTIEEEDVQARQKPTAQPRPSHEANTSKQTDTKDGDDPDDEVEDDCDDDFEEDDAQTREPNSHLFMSDSQHVVFHKRHQTVSKPFREKKHSLKKN